MGPLLPGDGRRDQAEGLARTRRAVRDGPDDSRSGLTEVCLGQLAPFIDDYKAALGGLRVTRSDLSPKLSKMKLLGLSGNG